MSWCDILSAYLWMFIFPRKDTTAWHSLTLPHLLLFFLSCFHSCQSYHYMFHFCLLFTPSQWQGMFSRCYQNVKSTFSSKVKQWHIIADMRYTSLSAKNRGASSSLSLHSISLLCCHVSCVKSCSLIKTQSSINNNTKLENSQAVKVFVVNIRSVCWCLPFSSLFCADTYVLIVLSPLPLKLSWSIYLINNINKSTKR